MKIPNPFTNTITKVMGGVLAASLLANVFLFWGYTHQVEKKTECVQAAKVVNQQATEKKIIIETRQDNVTTQTQHNVTSRIADLTQRVQDRRRLADLPGPTSTPAGVDGEGRPAFILSVDDELKCDIAVTLAEGWQQWYVEQALIRKEENANAKDNRVSSSRGGASDGSVSGLGERLDLGAGSDEPVGAPSIPAVFPQPAVR